MKPLYLVAPQAALDLVEIWRYIQERSSTAMADRVESVILDKLAFWPNRLMPDIAART